MNLNLQIKVCCFGDSHAYFFNNFPYCEGIYMGSQLAYTLNKQVNPILNILGERKANYPHHKIYALFCFGEIDIRAHLPKHNNVKECALRYVDAINKVKEKGYNIIVFGQIASTRWETKTAPPWDYPALGTCQDRNKIAKEFNNELESLCEEKEIPFFSILNYLVDDNGLTREEYYNKKDKIHLSEEAVPLVEPLLEGIIEKSKM